MHGTNHITITKVRGIKAPDDQKIFVEDKTIGIRDILRIVQEIALNEKRINRDKIARTGIFFFKKAINEAIDGEDIENICRKYLIPESKRG